MKKFLELIEVARREGVFSRLPDRSYGHTFDNAQFWRAVENCNPFVFLPKGGDTKEVEDVAEPQGYDERDMDAPFRVFSIEVLGDNNYVTIPRPDDKIDIYISCILIEEISPKVFCYYSLCELRRAGIPKRVVLVTNTEGAIIEDFLSRLKKEASGVEHIRSRVRIGAGKERRTATFRKVIHVKPKGQLAKDLAQGLGKSIEWSHRWAVRGHWRTVPGLGKNREGQYSVVGHTWVSEHEKGPEDAPLVTKTRLVC